MNTSHKMTLAAYWETHGGDTVEAQHGLLLERRPVRFRPVAKLRDQIMEARRAAALYPPLRDRIVFEIRYSELKNPASLTFLGGLVGADTIPEIFPISIALDGVPINTTKLDALYQRLQMMDDKEAAVARTAASR